MSIFSYSVFFLILLCSTNTSARVFKKLLSNTDNMNQGIDVVVNDNKDHVSRELNGFSICKTLPSINKTTTAPYGAKLILSAYCEEVTDVQVNAGAIVSGYCNIFNTTAQTHQIGTMRYLLDAAFDTNSLIMAHSTMRFFSAHSYQVVISGVASFPSPSKGGTTYATIANPTTFGISKVFVDQGLAAKSLNDCSLSKYSTFVVTGEIDGFIRTITFFR